MRGKDVDRKGFQRLEESDAVFPNNRKIQAWRFQGLDKQGNNFPRFGNVKESGFLCD